MATTQPSVHAHVREAALAEIEGLEGTRAIMVRARQLHTLALSTRKSLRRFELQVWNAVELLGVQSLTIQPIARPAGSPLLWQSGYYISYNRRTNWPWEMRLLVNGFGAQDFRKHDEDGRTALLLDIARLHVRYDFPVFEIEQKRSEVR